MSAHSNQTVKAKKATSLSILGTPFGVVPEKILDEVYEGEQAMRLRRVEQLKHNAASLGAPVAEIPHTARRLGYTD